MGNDGKYKVQVLGGQEQNKRFGPTNPEYWEEPFGDMPFWTVIEKLLETPDDIPGAIIRSALPDEKTANALIMLSYWADKFNDGVLKKLLKNKLASYPALYGRARLDALFGATHLIAPEMLRDIMHLKSRDREKVYRGGPDYREKKEGEE